MTTAATDGLRREVLANGVTLLVQRRRVAPAASLVTAIRAGFLDEPDELVGVSHVLEHMLFKGTPTLGPGELAQRTKELGGSLNAYTSYDRTVYYASVPARSATAMIALQADQVQHALIDAGELARELQVIIQEARRKLDSPGAVAGETLHELLYDTHRIRRWRIGSDEALAGFTHDDVAGYYASRYVPSRTIVSLVADIDEEQALDALRAAWGGWQRTAVPIPDGPVETSSPEVRARAIHGDVVLAELVLGWRAPGILDPVQPALDVAAAILGSGRGSRFTRMLREPGVVNAAGAGSYGVIDTGVFGVGAELDASRIPEALDAIGSSIRDLAEGGVEVAEFTRAQTLLRSHALRRLESYESRAIALVDAELSGDVTRLDREEADLLAVTPENVRDVVRQWLTPDGVSAVAYLPPGVSSLDSAMLRDAMQSRVAIPRVPAALPVVASVQPAQSKQRALAAGVAPEVLHVPLPGLDILAARFGEAGQTSIAVYRMRNQVEGRHNAGLAALAMRSMLRGTRRLDGAALAFAMEMLGGGMSISTGADVLGLRATVLTARTGQAAALLAETLHEPRMEDQAIATERALMLDDARAVADDMMRFPMQLALGVAFDDTGYGSPVLGTPDSIPLLDGRAVRDWHRHMLDHDRSTVVVVGDADPAWLVDQVANAFGSFAAGAKQVTGATARAGNECIHPGTRSETRDRKQSALAMLFPGPARTDAERYVAETWGAIAAGLGGRLFESLRSARSLAYTVVASSWQRRNAGGLLTYIATDPARLEEARDAMLEELDVFRREPPSAAELSRANSTLAGHVEMSRQSAGGLAAEIADAWLLGGNLAELKDPAAPYRQVTAEAVHTLAARTLEPALRAEGVVIATSA